MNNSLKKLFLVALVLLSTVLLWFGWTTQKNTPSPKPIHYHAGFLVVKNNHVENFSDFKYMLVKPCSAEKEDPSKQTPEEKQLEKAHLHDNVSDVVHVEGDRAIWEDLFTNIKYDLQYSHTEAFINGKKVDNFQKRHIEANDSLVVFIGKGNDVATFLSKAVTKKHMQEVETKSEDCGK